MSSDQSLSITQLTQLLNQVLEGALPQVIFRGEISELTRAASGHLYMTIKDETSQISAVMWRGMAQGLTFKPEPGVAVICHGKPNVYHRSGRLQIVVHRMTVAGEGLLQRKFLEMKEKLHKEGFFAEERKRKIPFFPRAIGVVTSGTGAVIHDISTKIRERLPMMQIYLADVRVQGEGAVDEIVDGIERLNRSGLVDVIIVARGGGSLEDLWAFNEEKVVRAIFRSQIPIVSGVGHEVDVTLADLAADIRAPTPTAAAEMVVPKRSDLLQEIKRFEERLTDLDHWFYPLQQTVDDLVWRLDEKMKAVFKQSELLLHAMQAKLSAIQPGKVLIMFSRTVELFEKRILNATQRSLTRQVHAVETLSAKLHALGPTRVLERGFAIIEHKGHLVRSSDDVEVGSKIAVTLARGRLGASVLEKHGSSK